MFRVQPLLRVSPLQYLPQPRGRILIPIHGGLRRQQQLWGPCYPIPKSTHRSCQPPPLANAPRVKGPASAPTQGHPKPTASGTISLYLCSPTWHKLGTSISTNPIAQKWPHDMIYLLDIEGVKDAENWYFTGERVEFKSGDVPVD
jgi:hypothetical protein